MLNKATVEKRVNASVTIRDNSTHAEARTASNPTAVATVGTLVTKGKSYTGSYESTPKTYIQTYDTNNTYLNKDFVVLEIPVHEAPNNFGTTITIGE